MNAATLQKLTEIRQQLEADLEEEGGAPLSTFAQALQKAGVDLDRLSVKAYTYVGKLAAAGNPKAKSAMKKWEKLIPAYGLMVSLAQDLKHL
jgi:hypothetical protein